MDMLLPDNWALSSKHSRGLLWKEFSENKSMLWWSIALTFVLFFVAVAYAAISNGGLDAGTSPVTGQNSAISAPDGLLVVIWAILAALNSAGMVSPELGSKTLQFLSSLPLSRNRIWWSKMASSLCMLGICLAVSTITYIVLVVWFCRMGKMLPTYHNYPDIRQITSASLAYLVHTEWSNITNNSPSFPYVLSIFAVGSLITVLVDRTITALLLTVVVSVIIGSLLVSLTALLVPQHQHLISVPVALLSLLFLYLSHQVFVGGETLFTSKRYSIILWIVFRDVGIVILALVAAYFILVG